MAKVEIYTSMFCTYCAWAKKLLERKGVSYAEIDISRDAHRRDEMIDRSGGRRTVPQIFVGHTHVGGYEDLAALDRAGTLDAVLKSAS